MKVAELYNLPIANLHNEYRILTQTYDELHRSIIDIITNKNEKPINEAHFCDTFQETCLSVLKSLHKYGLQHAFPTLVQLYKIFVALPIGTAKCERCFSKLELIKSRLRSTMAQERLGDLMVLSVESEVLKDVNDDDQNLPFWG